MKSAPPVSVLLSVYDGVDPQLFAGAVRSVQEQTVRDHELLIFSDGVERSDILKVISEAAAADSRIRVLRSSRNLGLAPALNSLVRGARGRFLARMDADDTCPAQRLERQLHAFDEYPGTSFLGTFAREIDISDGSVFEKRVPVAPDDVRRFLVQRDPFIHPSVIFRREFFDRVGGYSVDPKHRYLEDTELWSRALLCGESGRNVPQYLYDFRVEPGFWQRRRGVDYALREASIRLHYGLRAQLPAHLLLFPALTMMMRASPAWAVRLAYRFLRG